LPKLTGDAVLSWMIPIVFGRFPVAASASLIAVGRSPTLPFRGRGGLELNLNRDW
jgi:hypothetical protein